MNAQEFLEDFLGAHSVEEHGDEVRLHFRADYMGCTEFFTVTLHCDAEAEENLEAIKSALEDAGRHASGDWAKRLDC